MIVNGRNFVTSDDLLKQFKADGGTIEVLESEITGVTVRATILGCASTETATAADLPNSLYRNRPDHILTQMLLARATVSAMQSARVIASL